MKNSQNESGWLTQFGSDLDLDVLRQRAKLYRKSEEELESERRSVVQFSLGDGVIYAVDFMSVTEIFQADRITAVPCTPIMDGFEATEQIMATCPTPILVVSASVNCAELKIAFNALEAGALGVIEKPPGLHGDGYEKVKADLLRSIRTYHEIKVVHRPPRKQRKIVPDQNLILDRAHDAQADVVVMGASTGGPALLGGILKELPQSFPVPIVIVQHISEGFTKELVVWLNDCSALTVKIASHAEVLQPGYVYVAPYGKHLQIMRSSNRLASNLVDAEVGKSVLFCPAIDRLFESTAIASPGRSIGVLLTGMGTDGANGLLLMRKAGCLTVAQDEESSVVYGMPKEACDIGAVDKELAGNQVAAGLCKFVYCLKSDDEG